MDNIPGYREGDDRELVMEKQEWVKYAYGAILLISSTVHLIYRRLNQRDLIHVSCWLSGDAEHKTCSRIS